MLEIRETTHTIDKGEKFILQQLKALGSGAEITTGIQAEDFNKVQMLRNKPIGKTPLGVYAAWQEFGTRNSPARPFMLKTMDMTMNAFVKQTISGIRSIYNGNLTLDGLLKRQALRQQKAMKTTIKTWSNPDIKATTVRSKNRLKRRTQPLQETRTMLNAIKSKTKKHGGKFHPGFANLLTVADATFKKRRGFFG